MNRSRVRALVVTAAMSLATIGVGVAVPATAAWAAGLSTNQGTYSFVCSGGASRSIGTLSGAQPGETVTFTSPELGALLDGHANSAGQVGLIWQCNPNEAGTTWHVNAAGSTSGRTTTFTVNGTSSGTTPTSAPPTTARAPRYIVGTLGPSWNMSHPTLYVSYGGAHRYLGNIVQGISNWNNANANVTLVRWPGVPYRIHIYVLDSPQPNGTLIGLTVHAPGMGQIYTSAVITLYQGQMDGKSDFRRTKTATHELGHALGLPDEVSADANSIMRKGETPSFNTPRSYDIDRVRSLYS